MSIKFTKTQIQITEVENPHKFWYKRSNDATQERLLNQLEESLAKYVSDLHEWEEQLEPIAHRDMVAAFHPKWKKWIRAKAGKIKRTDKKNAIEVWAIDYGCTLLLDLESVFKLKDQPPACGHPINVHIGGLAGISPAKSEFNVDTFQTEMIKVDNWSQDAVEIFSNWICERKMVTFEVTSVQSGRNFGQLFLHGDDNDNAFCVATGLCDYGKNAIRDKKYMSDVQILSREDFFRLNHELAFWPKDEVDFDDNAAERIWENDEPLSSIDLEFEQNPMADRFSVNQSENASQHSHPRQSTHSGTHGYSSIAESSMSTDSMTLSVKTLNKLNLLVITDDDVVPAKQWLDACYFSKELKCCLMQLFRNGIEPLSSYGWPHIMRTNSLLLIGESSSNFLLCLPTICSITYRAVSDWTTTVRIEPIAVIFVSNTEDIGRVTKLCRQLLERAKMDIVNVYGLNSSFEIKALIEVHSIDILVTSVFCFQAVTQHMPQLFRTDRLRYVWFHQIDEMCRINESITFGAANDLLSSENTDIQVITTSKTYCPILDHLFHRVKMPMLLIGNQSPFEAALFAKSVFKAEIVNNDSKAAHLIDTLRDVNNKMSGSIVIVCANQTDVKYVTGSLTQANIKCIEFDYQYSGNQMKLVNWTKRCLSSQNNLSKQNILVCDDENLSMFPIRTAAHIIHYSLPDKLQTFMQRYITCYGFYEERLRRELVHNENDIILNRPFSLVYFDENHTEEYIETYELLLNRAQCELPPDLTEIVQELRFDYELRKLKPFCSEMITRVKDCDMSCPYRHVLHDDEGTHLPEAGFVNMDLLGVIAPNHFAVCINSYKRCLEHKSRPIENHDEKWVRFEETMSAHYSNGQREKHHPIEMGDMCLIFHDNKPKRCRVMSKSKKIVSVYLIDIGRVRNFSDDNLYRLDAEFQHFPPKAIEIFVLGYEPSDSNPTWLPEAKQYVERVMKTIQQQRKTENYLQAEVLKSFERTLIVKNLKIMYKGKGLRFKAIDKCLIKLKVAIEAPIKLHDVFFASENEESEHWSTHSGNQDLTIVNTRKLANVKRLVIAPDSNSTTNEYSITPREQSKTVSASESVNSEAFSFNQFEEPVAPPNSANILENGVAEMLTTDELDGKILMKSKHSDEIVWDEFVSQSIPASISAVPSLDEIFGSLPQDVQTADVLSPMKCENVSAAAKKNPAIDESDWLIDFSDSDNNDANIVSPSPFAHVRVINSIDDLL